jgi:aminoglycoside phosphotransferase (APT) family kinase protein
MTVSCVDGLGSAVSAPPEGRVTTTMTTDNTTTIAAPTAIRTNWREASDFGADGGAGTTPGGAGRAVGLRLLRRTAKAPPSTTPATAGRTAQPDRFLIFGRIGSSGRNLRNPLVTAAGRRQGLIVEPLPERLSVGVPLVRRLIDAQFPRWADQPIRPVPRGGWDNHTFRLGADMLVRLPSATPYALAVEKEQRWLPFLAPRLPLPIPVPLAAGRPDPDYPHPWSVYRWIDGETVSVPLDSCAAALADFLMALQGIDPAGGPGPGQHNWYRGGPLQTYDEGIKDGIEKLDDPALRAAIADSWQESLDAPWHGEPVWFHGDIAPGNLLTDRGALSAVIDFGTCGVGDPACDLAIAWTSLTAPAREAFRDRMGVDDAMWLRGRGWALWKATVAGPALGIIERILGRSS